ncbi:DUF3017 domain-containing protein [Cellulosimicrobium sp. CUA-896]|uniref:DUF3017 domain-containing protein n=1 Tax=Cellulosimicrobium sp. CUA-896 TaxID=1517881 RepID=UPI000959A6E7|nr:DUF3017 domain-containing protein [Cellulosimicrobium sp. CUA-896]OLT52453.1 hypothetical protein BJF88_13455 [Cellulosimicrobium sp. CUA-896]
MSDVTARGAARRATLVPSWHHVHDDGTPDRPVVPPDPDGTPSAARPPEPRARLAAGRQPAMWLALAGVGLTTAVALLVGARAACLVLAGVLAVAGLCRAVLPGPGPVGITVRSRGLDTFFFLAPAVAIAFLALSLSNDV